MKKEQILRYAFCALLYLLTLWVAKKPASEPKEKETAALIQEVADNETAIVPN